jgi:hypothetical protein
LIFLKKRGKSEADFAAPKLLPSRPTLEMGTTPQNPQTNKWHQKHNRISLSLSLSLYTHLNSLKLQQKGKNQNLQSSGLSGFIQMGVEDGMWRCNGSEKHTLSGGEESLEREREREREREKRATSKRARKRRRGKSESRRQTDTPPSLGCIQRSLESFYHIPRR